MSIIAISRDTLTETVDIVRIIATDSLAVINADGYLTSQILNIQALNNGVWDWRSSDEVLINYGATQNADGTITGGTNKFYQVSADFTSLVPSSLVSTAAVTLTAAQVLAAYATPQLLVAAPGAGKILVPTFNSLYTKVGTVFAGGGVGVVQWGATVHGAGTNALAATIPAAEITAAASQIYSLNGNTANALTGITNTGLYFSNQTAAFTGGANSTLTFNLSYLTINGLV